MKQLAILTIGLATIANANASTIDLYFQRQQLKSITSMALNTTQVKEATFQQLINHTDPALGTFSQRYFLDESYSTSDNSPVFFYLCGEATCTPENLDGTIRELAKKYNAKLIALEHRYYGKSIPTANLSTANLAYLTYQNALADIINFETTISQQNQWTGKWISFGGSYSGTVSAYFREKHPELTGGAIASSAPVMPKLTFPEFDEHVTQVAGVECANNMRQVMSQLENAMNNKTTMAQLKATFGASKVIDDRDFLSLVNEIGGGAIQYGYKSTFCGMLASTKNPLDGYATFAKLLYSMFQIDPVYLTPQGAMSENPADYEELVGARQWFYQTCSQFGGWTIASADASKSTSSKYLDKAYSQEVCRRLFNINIEPDIKSLQDQYYLPLLDENVTQKIYFSNGGNDPWSKMSLIDENHNTTNKKLEYVTIEGGSHCTDLLPSNANDSASLIAARETMSKLVGEWIK